MSRFVPQGWKNRPLFALIAILPQASRPLCIGVAVSTVVASLLPVAATVVTGMLVGGVDAAVGAGWRSGAARSLIVLLALTGVIYVSEQALQPMSNVFRQLLGQRVDRLLRQRLMVATSAPVGIGHLEDPAVADDLLVARSAGLGGFTAGGAARGLGGWAGAFLTGLGQAAVLATYRWWLALAVSATMLLTRRQVLAQLLQTIDVVIGKARSLRRADYLRELALTPPASKELRVFGLGGWVLQRYETQAWGAMREVWRRRGEGQWAMVGAVLASGVATLGAIAVVVSAGLSGEIDLTRVTVLVGATLGVGAFLNISDETIAIAYGLKGLPAVMAVERACDDVVSRDAASVPARAGDDAVSMVAPTGLPRTSIAFEDVKFAYPGRDPVYEGLDLRIEAGKSLAVVGVNGAGKTTLVKLLARLYEPTSGRITVDGIDIRDFDPRAWQRRVAAIFQDFLRFDLTAADNVGLGVADRAGDRALLERAAAKAGALEVIEGLPDGWDTVLSRHYEGGTDLSGGQWQRLALARALAAVEGGAGVLVLDEPTAALDVRAEIELFDRFLDVTAGLTTVLVSHRFSTVRRAERIVVVDGGRVVEDGTHRELCDLGGRYAGLFELQSRRFRDDLDGAHLDDLDDLDAAGVTDG